MQLSVIVLTSPGREENLDACLKALAQQDLAAAEIRVIDDGSAHGAQSVAKWSKELPLAYDWRPNDRCMSRSYNRAVAQTRCEKLVFISSDILLNPHSLSFYAEYYQALPPAAIWGYFGSYKADIRPSHLIPGRQVNCLDHRLWITPTGQINCPPQMIKQPQHFAWGGNWSLTRTLFMAVGGFNEHIQGWGYEDVEFANRLIQQQIHQIFAVDVWGEHQIHPEWSQASEMARNYAQIRNWASPAREPGLLYHPGRTRLVEHLYPTYSRCAEAGGNGTSAGQ
jgi:glycosyltransferase involved in cell wall biosynthesis